MTRALSFCFISLPLVFLALATGVAQAQYPSRPITLVVPYTAGSDADLSVRNLAEHAARHLAGKILVVNQPGAVPAVRSPQETEAFVRTQFALYFKLALRLGMRE